MAYIGIVNPLFRSSLIQVNGGFLLLGGAKGFQKYTKSIYMYLEETKSFTRIPLDTDVFTERCITHVRSH